MKKSLFICAAAVLALAACTKEVVKPISVTVKISTEKLDTEIPAAESYEVVATNVNTNQATTVATENGVATFPSLVPGVYNISASASVVAEGFSYNLAGQLSGVNLSTDGQEETIEVAAVKSSALVFKEIFYSGVMDPATGEEDWPTTYFRNQFYEIYNNSDQTVYVDGLCICATEFANYDYSVIYNFEIDNPEKYIFTQVVWQLPGNGTEYPVKPGESIVIAQWGTNHTQETLAPYSLLDLSGAEFEAVEKESTLWNGIVITDNAAINMKCVVLAGTMGYQWLTPVGGSRYVIFFPEGELKNSDFIAADGAYSPFREIPLEWVVDAVEAISDEAHIQYKGLPAILDAGYIWCSGTYVSAAGESIMRKTAETKDDGRIVYQDTNNTTNDFEVSTMPTIRRNNAGVPSWNTWIK